MSNNSKVVNIHGSSIDLSHKDLKSVKLVGELKKLNIFPHLEEDEQKEAYDELLAALNPSKKPETPKDEAKV